MSAWEDGVEGEGWHWGFSSSLCLSGGWAALVSVIYLTRWTWLCRNVCLFLVIFTSWWEKYWIQSASSAGALSRHQVAGSWLALKAHTPSLWALCSPVPVKCMRDVCSCYYESTWTHVITYVPSSRSTNISASSPFFVFFCCIAIAVGPRTYM